MRNWARSFIPSLALLGSGAAHAASIGGVTINPAATPAGLAATVTVTALITDPTITTSTVNLQKLDAQGRVLAVIGDLRDAGDNGDAVANDKIFSIRFTVYEEKPGAITYRVSAGVQGSLTRVFSTLMNFSVSGTFATGISITQPANLQFFNTGSIVVVGTTGDPSSAVRVNGILANKNGNGFQTSIPLQEGNNTITAVATNANTNTSTASIQVTLDTTPPRVIVESPVDNSTTTESVVTVSGIINDIVVGTVNSQQAQVTVGGVTAQVSNRTFIAPNVPLQLGLNTIAVVGRDQTGNSATTSVKITREPVTQPFIKLLSGNNQVGGVGSPLASPLTVQLLNGATPVPNTPVIFKITENDGFFQPGLNKPQLIVVNTNAQGQAQALLTLGNRAGSGNNIVEAYATGFQGTALFAASGTPRQAAKINVDSGNNQFGAVNSQLPLPFVAVVTDAGHNRLGGVPVTFFIRQGGGSINGSTVSYQTTTDGDGRALAVLTLGTQPGQDNNIVEATFAGNPSLPAAFAASARVPGNPALTSISGIVLDNSNNPIPNVAMRVFQTNQGSNNNQPLQIGSAVLTDAKGVFKILPAPVGFYKLMADGTTAVQSGKQYPTLEYDIVTVSGQDNTVGMPIYLPALDPAAKVCVNATTGGVLKISSSPGFSLTILPGSATFPGGSKTGCVSVTPVNPDKVPMVPGFGQQPRYVVTIQPVGTVFNPPAAITIPNMDGLAPNAKTEMYSFDHDLAAFVAIGSGTVTPDGSIIASDPGVGVIKAGWHCGGNPNPSGSAGTCPTCQKCQGSACIADDAQQPGACKKCQGGAVQDVDVSAWRDDLTLTANAKLPDALKNVLQSGLNRIPGVNAQIDEVRLGVSGKAKDCCNPSNGQTVSLGKKEASASIQASIEFRNVQIWPLPPTMIDKRWSVTAFGEIFEVRILFLAGVFIRANLAFGAEGGVRTDVCGTENCGFGGITGGATVGLVVEVAAQGCFDSSITRTYCTPTVDVSASPLTLNVQGAAGYNQANCNTNFSGFLKVLGVTVSFEFKLPLLPTLEAEYEVFGGFCLLGTC